MHRIVFAVIGLLLLPCLASATHFVESHASGTCVGYEADLGVEFHPEVTEINFSIVVTITDDEGLERFRYVQEGVLERAGPEQIQTYSFGANWNDVTDEIIELFGLMDIRVELNLFYPEDSPFWSTNTEGKTLVFDSRLECAVVDNDEQSWSALKADFR